MPSAARFLHHSRGGRLAPAGGVQALRNVSLTIEPGMYGLLGPNGAGETTLMKCLASVKKRRLGGASRAG